MQQITAIIASLKELLGLASKDVKLFSFIIAIIFCGVEGYSIYLLYKDLKEKDRIYRELVENNTRKNEQQQIIINNLQKQNLDEKEACEQEFKQLKAEYHELFKEVLKLKK
jgi:uncharacterized membrane protein YraQ (UPF0718 family)